MINNVTLAGRLTADPEPGVTANGSPFTDLALESEHLAWNGEQKDRVNLTARVYGEQRAATVKRYLSKGQPLMVHGHLRDSHQGLHLVVRNFQFLSDGIVERPMWVSPAAQADPAPALSGAS